MKKVLSILSLLILPLSAFAADFEGIKNMDRPPHGAEMGRPPMPNGGGERMGCPHHRDMKERLNLSDEQRERARALRMESQAKMKPLVDELNQKQSKKMALVSQNGDAKEIEQLGSEIKHLKQQIHGVIMQNERDFTQILTPEQKTEFNKMRSEGKREFHDRKFNGR